MDKVVFVDCFTIGMLKGRSQVEFLPTKVEVVRDEIMDCEVFVCISNKEIAAIISNLFPNTPMKETTLEEINVDVYFDLVVVQKKSTSSQKGESDLVLWLVWKSE